jgi:ABC-type multidrug transport system permease subunit
MQAFYELPIYLFILLLFFILFYFILFLKKDAAKVTDFPTSLHHMQPWLLSGIV